MAQKINRWSSSKGVLLFILGSGIALGISIQKMFVDGTPWLNVTIQDHPEWSNSSNISSIADPYKLQQMEALSQHLVSIYSDLTEETQREIEQYTQVKSTDVLHEVTQCHGLVVADDAVVVPAKCLLRSDELGLLSNRFIRSFAQRSVNEGQKSLRPLPLEPDDKNSKHLSSKSQDKKQVKNTAKSILGYDQDLQILYVQTDFIEGAKPITFKKLTYRIDTTAPLLAMSEQNRHTSSMQLKSARRLSHAYYPAFSGENMADVIEVHWPESSFIPGATFWDKNSTFTGIATFSWPQEFKRQSSKIVSFEAIKRGIQKYVVDRQPKDHIITFKNKDAFRTKQILDSIGLSSSIRDFSEFAKKIEVQSAAVTLPLTAEHFNQSMVRKTQELIDNVIKQTPTRQASIGSWEATFQNRITPIYSTQLEFEQTRLQSEDGGQSILPTVTMMSPPTDSHLEPNLLGTFRYQMPPMDRPRKVGDMADQPEDQAVPKDDTRSSEAPQTPRYAHLFMSKPLVSALLRNPDVTSQDPHLMTPREMLDHIAGPAGILIYPNVEFLALEHQKPFLLQKINAPVQTRHVLDGTGRSWQYFGFSLMDSHQFDSWCSAIPRGSLCLTQVSRSSHRFLREQYVKNIETYMLPQYIVESTFWSLDSLMKFQSHGFWRADPIMSSFALKQPHSDKFEVDFPTLGIKIEHPLLKNPHIRLTSAFPESPKDKPSEQDNQPSGILPHNRLWVPRAYEIYGLGKDNIPQLCHIGIVYKNRDFPKGSFVQEVATNDGTRHVYSHCMNLEVITGTPSTIRPKEILSQGVKPFPISVAKM